MENYCKFNDEELKQLVDDISAHKIIDKDIDVKPALRMTELFPDDRDAYKFLHDIIIKNKRELAVIEARWLNELAEKPTPDDEDYYFRSLFGKRFTGLSITEDNDLNLYFTDGCCIFVIKIDFSQGKISLSSMNPILNFEDVPEEHLTMHPLKLHVVPIELFDN